MDKNVSIVAWKKSKMISWFSVGKQFDMMTFKCRKTLQKSWFGCFNHLQHPILATYITLIRVTFCVLMFHIQMCVKRCMKAMNNVSSNKISISHLQHNIHHLCTVQYSHNVHHMKIKLKCIYKDYKEAKPWWNCWAHSVHLHCSSAVIHSSSLFWGGRNNRESKAIVT